MSQVWVALQVKPCSQFFTTAPQIKSQNRSNRGYALQKRRGYLCVAAAQSDAGVVVIGAGVSGLSCATNLHKQGIPVTVLEASDGVGGRVRTDKQDGFLLDRGFQIFLTSYPEAKEVLDYNDLDLRPFYAGALVRWSGDWHRVADPFRHPIDGIGSLFNPIGSAQDKINVGLFRMKTLIGSLEDLMSAPETSTLDRLRAEGFSEVIIDRFFRPFLGGIFFDRTLSTTSRLFAFVMRMLATGQNCLPAGGIGAVSDQLAARLPANSIKLHTKVASVAPGDGSNTPVVTLSDGTAMPARAVVVAVEGPEAARLLGSTMQQKAPSKDAPGVGTCCLYFSAAQPPLPGNVLYLNGEDSSRLVNNACFPSEVSSSYAPPGKTLVSVSTIGTHKELDDAALEAAVRKELGEWFGAGEVAGWSHLKTYRIPFAQPNQTPPTNLDRPVSLGGGLFVAGDHRGSATLDGAMVSGRKAAEAVVKGIK